MEKKEVYYYDSSRERVKKRIHNLFVREPVPYYLNEPMGTKILKVGKKTATVAAIATLGLAVLGPPVYALPNTFSPEGADTFQSGNPAAPEVPNEANDPTPNTGTGEPTPNPNQPHPAQPGSNSQPEPPEQKPNPQPTKPTDQPEQKPNKEPDSQPTKPTESPKPNTKPKSTNETPRMNYSTSSKKESNDSVQVAKETKVYGEESKAEKSGVVKATGKTKKDKLVEETRKSESEEIRTEDGGELPDTSTNSPLFAVLSSMGVLAGTGLLFSRRKVGE